MNNNERMVKISDKFYPDKRTVTMSRFEELQERSEYDRWEIVREAKPGEVNQRTSFGPNVQRFEDNKNEDEFMSNTNEEGEVVVELSKVEENNGGNRSNANEDLIEVDPYSAKARQYFSEAELSALEEAEKEENPRKAEAYQKSYDEMISDMEEEVREKKRELMKEDKRKNLRQSLIQHEPKYNPQNSITDLSPQEFAEIVNSDTDPNTELENQVDEMMEEWEEEQFGSDNEEENEEVELSEQEARECISSFEERGGVFAEFAREIEEESDIQGEVEELEENTEPQYNTEIIKHGSDAEICTSDPSLVSELESAKSETWTNVLEEGTNSKGHKEMTVEINNFEDNL